MLDFFIGTAVVEEAGGRSAQLGRLGDEFVWQVKVQIVGAADTPRRSRCF
jgi:hypothetical protein